MERETTTIQTPVGKQNIVLKTYLTGREKRELSNVFLKGKINVENAGMNTIDASSINEAQDVGWKMVIVSIDGKKDGDSIPQADGSSKTFDVVGAILDLRSEDFDFIVAEVNKITNGKMTVEKKTI